MTHCVEYIYDANSVIGMIYHNTTMEAGSFEQYVFEKNLQGDIVAVYSASGTLRAKYTYDAWGNVTTTYYNGGASTGAQYNSILYRGYYYDSETGLYYLNSRYYDPATGRFINPDIYINANGDLTGFNMYAYCSNNPVMYEDPSGHLIEPGTDGADAWQPYSLRQLEHIRSWSKSRDLYEGAYYLNKYIAEQAYAEGVSIENYEERYLHWVETGEPMYLYETTYDSPLSVYSSNLIWAIASDGGVTGFSNTTSAGICVTGNTKGFISKISNDCVIYNRNPSDKYVAMSISTIGTLADVVWCCVSFKYVLPSPVGALGSTAIYYVEQTAKMIFIGY